MPAVRIPRSARQQKLSATGLVAVACSAARATVLHYLGRSEESRRVTALKWAGFLCGGIVFFLLWNGIRIM